MINRVSVSFILFLIVLKYASYGEFDFVVSEEGPEDVFLIDEVTLYQGDYSDKAYVVSGQILDGVRYFPFQLGCINIRLDWNTIG